MTSGTASQVEHHIKQYEKWFNATKQSARPYAERRMDTVREWNEMVVEPMNRLAQTGNMKRLFTAEAFPMMFRYRTDKALPKFDMRAGGNPAPGVPFGRSTAAQRKQFEETKHLDSGRAPAPKRKPALKKKLTFIEKIVRDPDLISGAAGPGRTGFGSGQKVINPARIMMPRQVAPAPVPDTPVPAPVLDTPKPKRKPKPPRLKPLSPEQQRAASLGLSPEKLGEILLKSVAEVSTRVEAPKRYGPTFDYNGKTYDLGAHFRTRALFREARTRRKAEIDAEVAKQAAFLEKSPETEAWLERQTSPEPPAAPARPAPVEEDEPVRMKPEPPELPPAPAPSPQVDLTVDEEVPTKPEPSTKSESQDDEKQTTLRFEADNFFGDPSNVKPDQLQAFTDWALEFSEDYPKHTNAADQAQVIRGNDSVREMYYQYSLLAGASRQELTQFNLEAGFPTQINASGGGARAALEDDGPDLVPAFYKWVVTRARPAQAPAPVRQVPQYRERSPTPDDEYEWTPPEQRLALPKLEEHDYGTNCMNPINLANMPFGSHMHHRTAMVAQAVPRRPRYEREDVNVTDLVHRFTNLEMPSRAHMVSAASRVSGHVMHDMWDDVNMGQRAAMNRHAKTGPFAGRRGHSRVMNKSANVQGRSRGKLYETTIRRKVSAYELSMVMKKVRVHRKSGVGTMVFLHYGRTKKLIGDLTDIDLEELKRLIRVRLKKHRTVGLEIVDARIGGALHQPITHRPEFTRTLR